MKRVILVFLLNATLISTAYSGDEEPVNISMETSRKNIEVTQVSKIVATDHAVNVMLTGDALIEQGRKVFSNWCVICHGPEESATRILQERYKEVIPAELTQRTDLTPELIKLRIRSWGTLTMPVFRPTEVSDKDLEAVIAYLINNKK